MLAKKLILWPGAGEEIGSGGMNSECWLYLKPREAMEGDQAAVADLWYDLRACVVQGSIEVER